MMSMGFMPDSLNASDPSKSAFLEFGHGHQAHQQHSSGLSHIYPVHGLHAAGHSQHESPFPSSASYGRSLGYTYPGAVSSHPPSAYMSYQHSNHSNSSSLAHSRLEQTGMWEGQRDCCIIDGYKTFWFCATVERNYAQGANSPWHLPREKNTSF